MRGKRFRSKVFITSSKRTRRHIPNGLCRQSNVGVSGARLLELRQLSAPVTRHAVLNFDEHIAAVADGDDLSALSVDVVDVTPPEIVLRNLEYCSARATFELALPERTFPRLFDNLHVLSSLQRMLAF